MDARSNFNMKELVPDNIQNIIPYLPGKPVEEVERELGITGSIKLASNENLLGPSPLAINAVKKYLDQMNYYPESSGYYLRQKIAETVSRELTLDYIVLGNGSSELIEYIGEPANLIEYFCSGSFILKQGSTERISIGMICSYEPLAGLNSETHSAQLQHYFLPDK